MIMEILRLLSGLGSGLLLTRFLQPCYHLSEWRRCLVPMMMEMLRRVVLSTFKDDDASLSLPPVLIGSFCGCGDCFPRATHTLIWLFCCLHTGIMKTAGSGCR